MKDLLPMFDPYHKWLGIPPKEQPPHHYRLLGLTLFESDPDVIDSAANRQMAYLQGCATGTQALLSQRLLNEVAVARLCLLNPERKANYDARLKAKRSDGKVARPPSASVSVQVPVPGVRRDTSNTRFPILEGIDDEAEPYEVMSIPATPRGRRNSRKKSRIPVVASILVAVAALLVSTKVVLDLRSGTTRNPDKVVVEADQGSTNQDDAKDKVKAEPTVAHEEPKVVDVAVAERAKRIERGTQPDEPPLPVDRKKRNDDVEGPEQAARLRSRLFGTWKLVRSKVGSGDAMSKGVTTLRHFTLAQTAIVSYDKDGNVIAARGGVYTFKNHICEMTYEYARNQNILDGTPQLHRMRIGETSWSEEGRRDDGQTFEEVWERIAVGTQTGLSRSPANRTIPGGVADGPGQVAKLQDKRVRPTNNVDSDALSV